MMDLIRMKACTTTRITYLVLDEADRMFDMGFGEQVRQQLMFYWGSFRRMYCIVSYVVKEGTAGTHTWAAQLAGVWRGGVLPTGARQTHVPAWALASRYEYVDGAITFVVSNVILEGTRVQ
jgi:hypothetical protein